MQCNDLTSEDVNKLIVKWAGQLQVFAGGELLVGFIYLSHTTVEKVTLIP